MKIRVIAAILLVVLLVSVCSLALADRPQYRTGREFTIYAGTSLDSKVIGKLPGQTNFTAMYLVSVKGATWACIVLPDGGIGYITSGSGMIQGLRFVDEHGNWEGALR